jgi:hypothetical protein
VLVTGLEIIGSIVVSIAGTFEDIFLATFCPIAKTTKSITTPRI